MSRSIPARHSMRFFAAWSLPLALMAAAAHSGWAAWALMAAVQVLLALLERVPRWASSPPALAAPLPVNRVVLLGQVLLQTTLLAWALVCLQRQGMGYVEALALGVAVGGTTGSQGITFAHELGHSKRRLDRALGWWLMACVGYAHFMVEHYRGHHPRAASPDDPASARRGESLWRFLPRTLWGSWCSAWALERVWLRQRRRGLVRSPLLAVVLAQAAWLVLLAAALGPVALVFWLAQAAYAVFLLETVNYIEHYGLTRREVNGQREPFGMQHAWNADHPFTNALLINLQRHSDHHMHAWKPFATLEPLPGPQLPTGYAGSLFLASVPPLWFALMHPRLDALVAGTAPEPAAHP